MSLLLAVSEIPDRLLLLPIVTREPAKDKRIMRVFLDRLELMVLSLTV